VDVNVNAALYERRCLCNLAFCQSCNIAMYFGGVRKEAKEFSLRQNIYYSVIFDESPPCVLQSRNKSHNGRLAHSGFRTLVGLLIGWPRGVTNLAGPCVVQLGVDALEYQSYTVLLHVRPHYMQPF
jgi:hypothetical protein